MGYGVQRSRTGSRRTCGRRGLPVPGILVALGLVFGLVVLSAAPGAAPTARAQQDGTTLKVALTQEIDHLNPFLAIFQSSTGIGRIAYDHLTRFSAEKQEPIPGLATDWTPSDGNKTWTFTIRDDATWSDGEPVTAEDIAYTYNLIMDNDVAATANGSYVESFRSVTAPSSDKLVIKLKEPQVTVTALDIPIVPKHVWSNLPKVDHPSTDEASPDDPIVSSGPFVITDFEPRSYVRLKANKDYWDGAPEIDRLTFVHYDTTDTAVSALQSGEVDLINRLAPAQYEALQGEDNIALNKAQGRRFDELLMNPGAATRDGKSIGSGHPALQDVQVRRAISYAINPKVLVDRVLSGYAELGGGLIPPVYEGYRWDPGQQRRGFDPAKANELLDEAGYRRGSDGVRVGPDGKPLRFTLLGHKGESYDEQVSKYIVSWLRDIGIAVTPELVADNQLNERTTGGDYDLAFSGWGVNPDPNYVLSLHTCDARPNAQGQGGTTDSFFCDEKYDQLYRQQLQEADPDKREKLVHQMQQRLYEQAPMVVLNYKNSLEAYRSDRFAGFTKQPQPGGSIMEQNGYWGYYGAQPTEGGGIEGGLPAAAWIAIGVVVVAAGGGVVLLQRRRRRSIEDRE